MVELREAACVGSRSAEGAREVGGGESQQFARCESRAEGAAAGSTYTRKSSAKAALMAPPADPGPMARLRHQA